MLGEGTCCCREDIERCIEVRFEAACEAKPGVGVLSIYAESIPFQEVACMPKLLGGKRAREPGVEIKTLESRVQKVNKEAIALYLVLCSPLYSDKYTSIRSLIVQTLIRYDQ